MSLPKPTGLKAPSKISKSATVTGLGQAKSGIPGLALKAQSAIAKSARSAGFSTYPANLYAEEVSHKLPGPEPQVKSPPVDDFIIGDRVWVGGTKPGFIAFLGETQFAPGEWAGVVLDEPVGKNDGSVSGVRYFQCEAKRGVFARISKLSRTEGAAVSAPAQVSRADGERNGTKTPTSNLLAPRSTTPKLGQLSVSRTSSGSTSSLNKASPPPSATQLVNDVKHNFKTGDRVLVSGTKPGTLRYIGQTDFSKGIWAGVELDDPMGKNDGAVAGKRYFNCQPLYGLFAPVHKVAKLPGSATSVGMTTPRSSKLPASGGSSSGLRASRERSGSQDSVSSISSSASSVSRSRVRLGVGSLNNQAKATPSGRPSSLNLSATTSALQKALKEKEEHIEQLLRERDLERSEVARAAAQVDEAESQLANTKCEYDRFREDADESVKKMKLRLAELEKEKLDLTGILEDERRKTEDLQFQIEEESICKDDLEIKTEEDEAKVKDLEVQLRKEKERGDKFEAEVQKIKVKLESFQSESKSSTDLQTEYLDQIEELTHKLSQAENKIKTFESGKQDDNAKSSQLSQQLAERSQRLTEVEAALDTKKRDLKQMESRLAELETERKDGQIKHQKLQSTIDDLTAKLTQKDAASTSMNTEIQQLKTKFEDSQRQLQASKAKSDQLADDKQKLEQQIEDLMKNSGDSTSQLTILNEQLREKDRKLEEQLAALSNFTQKNAELNTSIDTLKEEHNRGVEELINKHKEELKTLQGNRDDLQAEVEKLHTKLTNLLEQHNEEKTELESSKLREVTILKENLQTAQNEQKHLQENIERNKTTMETFTADNENMKFEKEKLERTLKRLEGERDSLQAAFTEAQSEISAAKDEASKAQTELEQLKAAHGELGSQQGSIEEKLKSVNAEKEQLLKEKTQLEQKLQSSLTDSTSAHGQSERLRVENTELGSQVEKQAALVAQHLQQISKLTEENQLQAETLRNLQEEGKVSAGLQSELDEVKAVLLATQNKLSSAEQEKEGLKAENSTVLQQLNDNQRNFEGTKAQFESSLQELTQRVADISSESESTKTRLKDSLDNSTNLLQQREQEISAQKTQIASLEREKTALEDYRTRSSELETEVTDLRQQLSNLHTQLEESKSSAALINNPDVDGDPVLAKLKSEKESLGGQVEFLNSVIVELQNKNEALAVRLQAMEAGDHINGGLQAAVESPSKVRPPRLFCDICDIFDKHETEDCPLQAMSDSETPPPSSHHGSRTAERAYCDICEVFGHWTTECDDEQTF